MLTQRQIDQFHRDGFLKIPQVFVGEELARLRQAASATENEGLAEAGDNHLYHRQADGSKSYFRSEKMWSRDAIFRIATVKPELLAAVAQCIGHPFMPWNDSLVTKQPQSNVPIPFHQDPPYYKKGEPTSSIPDFVTDVYLDHSTVANGCVHGLPAAIWWAPLILNATLRINYLTNAKPSPWRWSRVTFFFTLCRHHTDRAITPATAGAAPST